MCSAARLSFLAASICLNFSRLGSLGAARNCRLCCYTHVVVLPSRAPRPHRTGSSPPPSRAHVALLVGLRNKSNAGSSRCGSLGGPGLLDDPTRPVREHIDLRCRRPWGGRLWQRRCAYRLYPSYHRQTWRGPTPKLVAPEPGVRPSSAKSGGTRPNVGQVRPSLEHFVPVWIRMCVNCDQHRSTSGQIRPALANCSPNSDAKSSQCLVHLGQVSARIGAALDLARFPGGCVQEKWRSKCRITWFSPLPAPITHRYKHKYKCTFEAECEYEYANKAE